MKQILLVFVCLFLFGIPPAVFAKDFKVKTDSVRIKKGWNIRSRTTIFDPDRELDKLAGLVRNNIDMKYLYKILKDGV